MELKDYLAKQSVPDAKKLAATLGISRVYLGQIAQRTDNREASPALCVKIEEVTAGKVTRKDLRPHDWRDIWPELRPRRVKKPLTA